MKPIYFQCSPVLVALVVETVEYALMNTACNHNPPDLGLLLSLDSRAGILSFAGGLPASSLLPTAAAAEAAQWILGHPQRAVLALQYAPTEGYPPLREWIAEHMRGMGVPSCDTENIIVTSGSQQALDLLGRIFLQSGDIIMCRVPTYAGAIQAFSHANPHYAFPCPDDDEQTGYSLAYAVPDFSNPTGESMDMDSRLRLLDLARKHEIPLIEDAAYSALSFTDVVLPSCLTLEAMRCGGVDNTRVAYCGTFSKMLSPGLRVGWVCAAKPLIAELNTAKQATDLQASSLGQMIVHRILTAHPGGYRTMAAHAAAAYEKRCDSMMSALREYMPREVSWTRPLGGMFTWLTLPAHLDSTRLLEQAVQENVTFVPGNLFHPHGGGARNLRLSWSQQDEEGIREGMRRLGTLMG